eukprot:ctg_5752.g656
MGRRGWPPSPGWPHAPAPDRHTPASDTARACGTTLPVQTWDRRRRRSPDATLRPPVAVPPSAPVQLAATTTT